MMASPHTLVEGVIISSYAIRANHAFIYVRGEVLHVVRRLQRAVQEAYLAGHLGKDIHGSGYDLERGRARRRRRLHLRRGDRAARLARGSSRPTAAAPAVPRGRRPLRQPDGDQQRRVDRVGAEHRRPTAPSGSPRWAPRRARATASSRCPATSRKPGQYEAPLGITLRELIDLAGGMREGHELKFWTPGGSSTPILTAEHLDVPLDFEGDRRGRLDARHPRAADLRRDHLRGAGGAALDRVLQARVLRQVHAVPRGHLVAGADAGQPREGPGRARPTSSCCSTSATTSSAARSARSADGAVSPITSSIQYFREEYLAHLEHGGCPFDRDASTLFAPAGAPRMTTTPEKQPADGSGEVRLVTLTIDDVEVTRAQGHPGDPGRRADRRPDPAVLRPPAARARSAPAASAWSRCPTPATVAAMPKPQASCTHHGRRGHGGQHPGHVAGRRQGAAGASWSSC